MIEKQRNLKQYKEWYAAIHSWPHADILMQIKDAERHIQPLVMDYHHVYSHQDDKNDYEDLEDDAKLNTQCDILATEELI